MKRFSKVIETLNFQEHVLKRLMLVANIVSKISARLPSFTHVSCQTDLRDDNIEAEKTGRK